jgi:hypothetical protein
LNNSPPGGYDQEPKPFDVDPKDDEILIKMEQVKVEWGEAVNKYKKTSIRIDELLNKLI